MQNSPLMNKNIHRIACLLLVSALSGCSISFLQFEPSTTPVATEVAPSNNNEPEIRPAELSAVRQQLTGLELELHQALKQDIGDERIRALLQQGADSNRLDEHAFPAFFYLLAMRSADLVRLALDQGADPSLIANDIDAVRFTRDFWQPEALRGGLRVDGDSYVFNLAQQQPEISEIDWPSADRVPNELFIEQIGGLASVSTYLWRLQALSQRDWLRPRELLQQDFDQWLATAQQRREQLGPVAAPVLPAQEQITKGDFESNSMFQRRLGEVISNHQNVIDAIADDFRERVEARNRSVLELQSDTQNKIVALEVAYQQLLNQQRDFYDQLILQYGSEVEPRLVIEAFALVCGAFELKRTNPDVDLPDYNPETEVMRALLSCSRANYSQRLSFSVVAGEPASNFYRVLAADELRPELSLQINQDKQISVSELQISIEGKTYRPFNELSPVVPAGIDLSTFFASGLIILPPSDFSHPEVDSILAMQQQDTELALE